MVGATVAAVIVSVTGMVLGVFVAPMALMVIVALYVPAVRPVMLMLMVEEPDPVPVAGLGVSHVTSSVTVQLSVPPPVLDIVRVWLVGFAPPCVAVKPMLVGL